jgi:hypothetical protein
MSLLLTKGLGPETEGITVSEAIGYPLELTVNPPTVHLELAVAEILELDAAVSTRLAIGVNVEQQPELSLQTDSLRILVTKPEP